jgi:hypothetical protein
MNTGSGRRPSLSSRRSGASLVFTVVMLLGILAVLALAIDLGMLFTARAEAQRAADAGALAGASAFQEVKASDAIVPARARALAFAERNHIRNRPIQESEVTVEVKPDSELVRVWVRRDSLPTWFARLIGVDYAPVGAHAAARALPGSSATCLKPFAVPDIWNDGDQDTNTNRLWDTGEAWSYDGPPYGTAPDNYSVFDEEDTSGQQQTGYGSDFRDGSVDANGNRYTADYGRPLTLKTTDPQSEFSLTPGIFLPWRLPVDPNQEDCATGGGGLDAGAAVYRKNICSCNMTSIELHHPYELEPGNMVGPTNQGIKALVDQDQDAYWDPSTGTVRGSVMGDDNWQASPRVVKLALFSPGQVTKSGMQTIEFNNFAWFFIEGQANPQAPVVGRFIGRLPGDGESQGPTGSLVRVVRLVE